MGQIRASSVIIVSSGRSHLLKSEQTLDGLIREIVSLKKNPILVLGPDGDDILRHCDEIEKCDIVFDPNFNGGFFSGVKAGLFATAGASIVVPLSDSLVENETGFKATIETLETHFRVNEEAAKCHLLCPMTQDNTSISPRAEKICLITPQGASSLLQFSSELDWESAEEIAVRHIQI